MESNVVLVRRVHEVLYLRHRELSHSQQALLWVDLISESESDLGSCERHLAIVEVEKSLEVDENTLGGLWTEEPSLSASRSDLCLEH